MLKKAIILNHIQSSFLIRSNVHSANVKLYCTSLQKNDKEKSAKVLSKLNIIKNLDFKEYKERSSAVLQNKWTDAYTFYERVFHMVS